MDKAEPLIPEPPTTIAELRRRIEKIEAGFEELKVLVAEWIATLEIMSDPKMLVRFAAAKMVQEREESGADRDCFERSGYV